MELVWDTYYAVLKDRMWIVGQLIIRNNSLEEAPSPTLSHKSYQIINIVHFIEVFELFFVFLSYIFVKLREGVDPPKP